ncbi:Probable jasmonic acid carboxyl methyltransferase 2 [Linum perenne]
MEVVKVLHMNQGNGKTSYANNSTLQSKIISLAKQAIEDATEGMLQYLINDASDHTNLGIADLGCSSGPNVLRVVSEIIDIVHTKCIETGRPTPDLNVFLNDLHSNDFNSIIKSLPEFHKRLKEEKGELVGCFVSCTAGSFYGRLFPKKSLHLVHSSSSLHWLSQGCGAVVNKGRLYISKSSPNQVMEAYTRQFQDDFSLFLRSRAEELVIGGHLVMSFMGRTSSDPTLEVGCHYQWELLAYALISMIDDGYINEEKLDSFNAPYYAPSGDEVRAEVEKEGSFSVDKIEAFEVEWDGGRDVTMETRGERVARTIRAVVESMIESHFGEEIIDELFNRYAIIVDDYLSKNKCVYVNLVVSLARHD